MARKFIDREPPFDEEDIHGVFDYLFYLKDSLNFIFNSYGGQLNKADEGIEYLGNEISGKVDADGNTICFLINSDDTTYKIKAEKIDLEDYALKASLSSEGGVAIHAGNITKGAMKLKRTVDGVTRQTETAFSGQKAQATYADQGYINRVETYSDSAGFYGRLERAPEGTEDFAGVYSFALTGSGLTFYDGAGNVTASYPATT